MFILFKSSKFFWIALFVFFHSLYTHFHCNHCTSQLDMVYYWQAPMGRQWVGFSILFLLLFSFLITTTAAKAIFWVFLPFFLGCRRVQLGQVGPIWGCCCSISLSSVSSVCVCVCVCVCALLAKCAAAEHKLKWPEATMFFGCCCGCICCSSRLTAGRPTQ